MQGHVPTLYPDPFGPMSQPWLGSQHVSPTGVQLCRLPFRPLSRPGQTHAGEVDISHSENQLPPGTRGLLSHVPYWTSDSHRKTGGFETPSHEAYPVAFKEVLAHPGILREDDPSSKASQCPPQVVVEPRQSSDGSTFTPITARPPTVYRRLKRRLGRTLTRLHRKRPMVQVVVEPRQSSDGSTFTPITARLPTVYRRLKRRLGRTLRRLHCKRPMVQVKRKLAHNLELKAVLLALKQFEQLYWNQTILVCNDNTTVVSYINKEGGMKGSHMGSLCALLGDFFYGAIKGRLYYEPDTFWVT